MKTTDQKTDTEAYDALAAADAYIALSHATATAMRRVEELVRQVAGGLDPRHPLGDRAPSGYSMGAAAHDVIVNELDTIADRRSEWETAIAKLRHHTATTDHEETR